MSPLQIEANSALGKEKSRHCEAARPEPHLSLGFIVVCEGFLRLKPKSPLSVTPAHAPLWRHGRLWLDYTAPSRRVFAHFLVDLCRTWHWLGISPIAKETPGACIVLVQLFAIFLFAPIKSYHYWAVTDACSWQMPKIIARNRYLKARHHGTHL